MELHSWNQTLNLSQDRMVVINQLADMIAEITGVEIVKVRVPGPQGVNGRNSDNTLLPQVLGWEPEISLEEGLARTYAWIEEQVRSRIESAPESERDRVIAALKHSKAGDSPPEMVETAGIQ